MKAWLERITNGILRENPVLVQMIGMCASLAVSTSVMNGIGMGLSTTVVLVFSNLIISAMRKVIPDGVRIPAFIVIVATLVTVVDFLMEGFFPSLYDALGIYIPLIVVNCIILGRAEAYASKNPVMLSVFDGIGMGLGFTCALCVIGAVRELLGAGQILGIQVLPLADEATGAAGYTPITIFVLAPGAFFVMACVQALMNVVRDRAEKKGRPLPAPSGCMTGECMSCASASCASRLGAASVLASAAKAADQVSAGGAAAVPGTGSTAATVSAAGADSTAAATSAPVVGSAPAASSAPAAAAPASSGKVGEA